jgi:hypothetical protein
MFEEIINKVLKQHNDFTYNEIEELCKDFYDEIPKKIKEETKIKRVKKYIIKEFELEENNEEKNIEYKDYSLEKIPKYLFE